MVTPISGNVNPSALGGKLSSITNDIDIQVGKMFFKYLNQI